MRQNAPCEGRCSRDHTRRLASLGRHGDTLVAHISPLEAAILRLLGGSGTINPKTGLPEFFAGGPGGVGRDSGGAVAGGASGIGGRGVAGASGGPSVRADSGSALSRDQIDKITSAPVASAPGFGIERTKRNGLGNVMNSTTADASVARKLGLTNDQYDKLSAGYRNAITDSYDDGVGGLLGLLGLHERVDFDKLKEIASGLDPGAPAPESLNNAGWGFDVIGTLANVASLATGIPFDKALMAAKLAAKQMGIDTFDPDPGMGFGLGEVDLGNDVFGSGSPGANQTGVDVAQGPGMRQGLGAGNSRGGTVAQNAQKANAGGGLLAAVNQQPNAATSAALPDGLLAYLARNPGMLPGHRGVSRFGTGDVAPINYLVSYA